jgi:DNA repair photolyase
VLRGSPAPVFSQVQPARFENYIGAAIARNRAAPLIRAVPLIIEEKPLKVEEIVQDKKVAPSPSIARLHTLDFWYWARYYADIFSTCPFNCAYCHAGRRAHIKGMRTVPGLPDRRMIVGLGLFCEVYGPGNGVPDMVAEILRGLDRRKNGVSIQTKSALITKHLEILQNFARRDRARVTFTLLTLEQELSKMLEGSAPAPGARLEALDKLVQAGVPAGIAAAPLIPLVNDQEHQLENLVREAAAAGAQWLLFSGFDPLPRFFAQGDFEETEKLMKNPGALQEHYEKVKNNMIRLTSRYGLPLRIPRMALYQDQGSSPEAVSEHLFNISYYYELAGDRVETRRYRRAAYAIEAFADGESPATIQAGASRGPAALYPGMSFKSIVFQNKLGYIRGINPEIERVVEEFTRTGSSQSLTQALNRATEHSNG